jgi:O-antigen ligase
MAAANRLNFSALAFWCFALSAAWLPIGFGGDYPIPLGLAQLGFAISCLLLVLAPHANGPTGVLKVKFFPRLRWALGMLVAVVIWAWLQAQSFVPDIFVHPLWKEASAALKTQLAGTIAVSPEDALYGLSRLITYLVAGLLGYVLGQDAARGKQFIQALWLTGVVICAYGLLMKMTGSTKLLWLDKWIFQDDVTATFVNRNNFALYAGMVLVCGMALLGQSWREDVETARITRRAAALKAWIVKEGMPQVFLLMVVMVAITLSHSRAGFVLALAGIGGYIFFYQLYLKSWHRAIVVAMVAILAAMIALTLIQSSSDSRFSELFVDYSSHDRFQVYGWTLRAIGDNPWLGYGLGSFPAVYRLYQQDMVVLFQQAHSDILESLLDLGIPFGLLLWAAVLLLVSGLWHGVRHRRRHGMFPVIGLTVSLMALAHSFVDFSLQIPGVSICWASLVGIGLAQSWRQLDKNPTQQSLH